MEAKWLKKDIHTRSHVLLQKRVPDSWPGKWKMLSQAFAYTEFEKILTTL